MVFNNIVILLTVFIFIPTNSTIALAEYNCLRTLNLESKNPPEEENNRIVNCVLYEMIKREIKLCNSKCFQKLTLEQKEKYFKHIDEEMIKIIDEELETRRVLQSLEPSIRKEF